MRLACAAEFRQGLDRLPLVDAGALERAAELLTQLRSAGYSGAGAAQLTEQVLSGEAVAPRASARFARIYGDESDG
jgi:hypothetical protein